MSRIARFDRLANGSIAFAVAVALSGASLSVQAADEPTSPESGAGALEEVVVTANKREESLQEVPLAVSAIN